MRAIVVLLLVGISISAYAVPLQNAGRIVGGTITTIDQYPYGSAVLVAHDLVTFRQNCGGSILNTRSVLTAAHCLTGRSIQETRLRVGSSFGNSGGTVHAAANLILHPNYNEWTVDCDIAIVHSATTIVFNNLVQPGSIAGPNYVVPDNTPIWAIGWGMLYTNGPTSEQLRHVQVYTINQQVCQQRWGAFTVTPNMLCSGRLDAGGFGQCQMDSGGPVIHNNVIIGVTSFGSMECGSGQFPTGNVRVSQFTSWIQANA